LQNMLAAFSRAHIQLYSGKSREALAHLTDTLRHARRGFLLRPIIARIDGFSLRARAALAVLDEGPKDSAALLRSAVRDTNTVISQKQPWAIAFGYLLQAGIAFHRRRVDQSVALLEQAAESCRATHMELFVRVANFRRGQLLGGDEGRALMDDARAFMKTQEIERPDRMTQLLAPGFGPRERN